MNWWTVGMNLSAYPPIPPSWVPWTPISALQGLCSYAALCPAVFLSASDVHSPLSQEGELVGFMQKECSGLHPVSSGKYFPTLPLLAGTQELLVEASSLFAQWLLGARAYCLLIQVLHIGLWPAQFSKLFEVGSSAPSYSSKAKKGPFGSNVAFLDLPSSDHLNGNSVFVSIQWLLISLWLYFSWRQIWVEPLTLGWVRDTSTFRAKVSLKSSVPCTHKGSTDLCYLTQRLSSFLLSYVLIYLFIHNIMSYN